MVAVVSGNGLGLLNSSLSLIGARGGTGSAGLGQGGSAVFVNSATGNLLIQGRDEFLSATGADLTLVRTYNSQGLLNDDNADNWQLGVHRRIHSLTGTVNTAGSSVRKTFGDGTDVLYAYDTASGRYVSTAGDGAHDALQWSSGSSQWTWTDGSARATEVYDSTGRLLISRDTDGNTTTYAYTGSLLTQITDSSSQVTFLDYTGTNLTQIRTVISGATQTRTRYGYDGSNRLTSVTFDLTPADNAIADGRTFVTTYAYDGTSKRVASITHSDGTAVSFTYELSGGLHRVKTYTDGEGKVTTLTYSGFVAAPTTAVANGAALSTTDTVTATNNYSLNGGALTTPPNGWGGATLRESTTSATNDPRVAFDANGNGVLIYRVGSDIKAQRYTRATNSWSAEVTLDTRTNTTYAPSLSVDAGGNAIAAWVQSDGTANSVYAARFDGASGTWGAPALIDGSTATFPVNTAANSLVTSISGTRASVAWQHNVATTGSVYDLYVARFNGTSWAAAELVDARTNNAAQPSVAIDNQGNVTVAFQQSDGTANSIYANRFTASSGTWSGAVLRESTTSATNDPRVAFDANGNGVLIYRVGSDIKAQRYTRATNSWSAEVTLDTRTNTTYAPSLSVDAGGNAIAAWVQSDGTANSVYAARVDGASGTWGAPALIDGSTATFPVNTAANSLVTSISGTRASVAWRHNVATTGSVYDLYVARFNGTSWAAAELVDARTNNAAQPSVAIDNQGNVTVAFQQSDGTANSIYTNRYLSGGAAYYTIPSGATWQSIASTLYGINSAAAGTALQTAMGNPPLVVGNQMSGWPATLSVTSTTTTTVPPYYTVQSGNTWTSITQTVYGTSDTAAVAALQSAMGNPTLTVGLKLTVPSTLSYTSASGPQIAQTIDVSSSLGLVTTLQNDTQGRLTALLSPTVGGSRLETRFAYDGSGNVSSVTEDPTGRNLQTVYGYDASGNLLSSRDARGNTVTRTYSATNQVLTETAYTVPDPDGAGAGQPSGSLTTRYVYDGEEHLRFVVTGEGRVTEYRYDAAGNRTAMLVYTGGKYDVGALAATASLTESQLTSWVSTQNLTQLQRTDYGYDFRGNLSNARTYATTDALGVGVTAGSSITRYVYDQRGLLLQTIDARGEATGADPNDFVTNYTYDSLGRMLTSVRWTAAGNVTTATNVYNDAARTATVTLSNGLITTTTFDRVGRVVSMAASGGAGLGTTTYTYDSDGRLRMVTDPLGVKSHMVYDAAGRKSFTVDGTGTLTEYIYDRTSNLVKTVEYAAAANVALLTDAGGAPLATVDVTALRTSASGNPSADRITRAVYDAANRVVFTIDAAGNVVKNFYDGASRVTDALAYAAPVTIARTVDALTLTAGGDISGVTLNGSDANNRLTRMFYDAEGRLLATLDGAGYLVENVYDAAGRLLQTIAYADATPVGFRASGTLAQLRPAADTETAIDFERDIVSWYFYDGHGRRVGQLDGEGYLTEWTYDAAGNVASQIRYPSVRTWTGTPTLAGVKPANTSGAQIASFQYDEQNRVTQETDHQGTVTQYQYDTVGNLTRTTRALGTSEARVSQARYDLLGRVVAELTPEGSAAIVGGMTPAQIDAVWTQYGVSYAYNAAGQRVSMTDQYGNVTLYFYDADNRLRFAVNALGEVAENRYNALGQVTEKIAYANRIATSTLAGGAINATLTTRVTAAADAAKDAKTTYTYALNGRLASETTAEGGQITYAYNAFNELQSSTQLIEGATSVVTQYEYDTRGLTLRQRTDPSGLNLLEQTSYNAFGQAVSVTDARGNVRYLRHDRNGRTVTSLDAFGKSTNTSYDAFDRVLTVTDRLGNATTYVYNDTTRSVVVTTQEGVQLTTVMNRHGQTATITDGRGTVTTYEYDANGQLKRTFDTLGNRGQQTYDRAGRAVDTIDANGVITRITYDAASRVYTRTVDPGGLNLTTTYGYDGRGQAITVTDERGVVTTTAYDREGNVVTVAVDPTGLNLRTTYAYDKRGLLRVTTEGAGSANPRTVTYAYDAAGRRTSETVVLGLGQPDAVTQYKYDANGNLTRRIDARNFSTWYVYDVENRLRYTVDALGGVTQTSYDDEGRVTAMRRHATAIASGTVAGYGDVVTLALLGTPATSSADRLEETVYDRDGRAVYAIQALDGTGAGLVTVRTFDANGNVVRMRMYATPIAAGTARTAAGIAAALTPSVTQDRESATVYDIRNRAEILVDAAGGVTRQRFDGNGNVVEQTQFATPLPAASAMRVWHVPATNSSASRYLGKFAAGDVVTATVRFRTTTDSTGMMFLGDAGGPDPYDNATQTAVTAGIDGWRTLTLTWTMSHADDMWVYLYGNRDGATPNASQSVLYDGLTITSVQRGTVVADNFDAGITEWGVSGNVQLATVTLADLGTDASVRALVDGLATSTRDRTTRYWYDAAGRQAFMQDAEGYITENRYSDATRTEESLAYVNAPTLAQNATLAQVRTAAAGIANAQDRYTKTEYDRGGRVWRVTDAYLNYEEFGYDAVGNRTSYRNEKGSVWTYVYDANSRLIEERSPVVQIDTVADAGASLVKTTDAASIVTRMIYDALGNVTSRIEAYGRAEARTTSYEYDKLGRQTRTVYPAMNVYSAPAGDEVRAGAAVVRAESAVTPDAVVTYNALGDAVVNKDVAGSYSHKVYDRLGRVQYEVDAENYVTEHRYDVFGNEIELVRYSNALSVGALTLSAEWSVGQITGNLAVNAAADRKIAKTFDRLNRTQEVLQPGVHNYLPNVGSTAGGASISASARTLYEYNAFGEVVRARQLVNPSTTTYADTYFYYDRRGLKTASVDPLGHLTVAQYDARGNVVRQVEFANPIGSWTTTSYVSPEQVPLAYAENANDTIANGVMVVGDTVRKSSGYDGWDTGFRSRIGYTGGATVTYTVSQNNKYLMVGLNSDPTSDNSYGSIDYALYTAADGNVYVYENGAHVDSAGAYAAGDVFSVSYDGSHVRYFRNGVAFRTVAASIAGPLYADASFYSVGGEISGLEFRQDYLPRGGVVVRGDTATKLGGASGWDAGFRSKVGYVGGAAVTFTAPQTGRHFMVGLNTDPASDDSYASIDWALYARSDGSVAVYENGAYIGEFGTYSANDSFRVSYENGKILYSKNGTVLREVAVAIAGALYADSSFYEVGAEVTNIQFGRSAKDREVVYSYDRLDRQVTETRLIDDVAGLARDRTTTTYGYDAVGNRTSVTDAFGATTYTYYDVLGRSTAIAEPSRDVDGGSATSVLVPLTVMARDAYGNLVEQVQYANGAASAGSTGYTVGAADGARDRVTRLFVDRYGHVLKTSDPEGALREASYNLRGEVAKEWQHVVNNDGLTEAIVTIYQYDRLGRQTAVIEPARLDAITQIVRTEAQYNAFGEVIRKGINGGQQEYFDYDLAGRVWRTNSGDGVHKVYLYDLLGNLTGEIRSQTRNLKTDGAITSSSAALALGGPDQMRVETRYDVLGRAVEQREVSFVIPAAQEAIPATFSFGTLTTPIPANAVYQEIYEPGDPEFGWGGYTYYIYNPTTWENGGGFYETSPGNYARVAQSSYQLVSRAHIYWNTPSEIGITRTFEYRVSGGSWQTLPINQVLDGQIGVDVSGLVSGAYEFRVGYTRAGDSSAYAIATGTFNVSNSSVTTLSTTTTAGAATPPAVYSYASGGGAVVYWIASSASAGATVEIRQGGGAWQAYGAYYSGGWFYGTVPTMNAGSYEYRITETVNGSTVALGTGTISMSSASNSTSISTHYPDAAWEAIAPISASATVTYPPSTVSFSWQTGYYEGNFSYAPAGSSAWTYVEVGWNGSGLSAALGSLPAGTYDFAFDSGQTDYWDFYNSSYNPYEYVVGQFVVGSGTASIISQTVQWGSPGPASVTATAPPPVSNVTLQWAQPSDPSVFAEVYYRAVGATNWSYAGAGASGGQFIASLGSLGGGTYEYMVYHSVWRYEWELGTYPELVDSASGQFSVNGGSASVLSQNGTPSYLPGVTASADRLYWTRAPQAGDSIVVIWNNYSLGTSGTLTPQTSDGANYSASLYGLATGNYTYRVEYRRSGQSTPYMLGSGYLSLTTGYTPPATSNSQATGAGQITGFADGGNNTLYWTTPSVAGAAVVFRYRAQGASGWAGTLGASAYGGGYAVNVASLSGAIEYEVTYTRPGESTPYMVGHGTTVITRNIATTGSLVNTTATTLQPVQVTPRLQQAFDRWGQVLSVTDAAQKTTNYRYNQLGGVVEVRLPSTNVLSTINGVIADVASVRAVQRNYYDVLGRLVGTRDGNGNVNVVAYNAAGQLLSEQHADGGSKQIVYDGFGQQLQVTEQVTASLAYRARMAYDRTGNLRTLAREVVAGGFASGSALDLTATSSTATVRYDYAYDKAGRRLSETNGEVLIDGVTPETTRYWYDLRGNVTRRRTPRWRETTYEYDTQGNKTLERNANNETLLWSYDYFGRVQTHTDLGGAVTTYTYSGNSGLLGSQVSTLGQNIAYSYDAAGHLTRITDRGVATGAGFGLAGVVRDTEISYDAAGRRAREKVIVDGNVHQDTRITYDELGRIYQLSDLRYRTTYRYDAAGNRSRIQSTYFDHVGALKTDDLWYTYDAMNRVKISQGVNAGGTVGISTTQGVELTYDWKGQRTSARQYGKELTTTIYWDWVDWDYTWEQRESTALVAGYDTEYYGYDGLGRLASVDRRQVTIEYPNPYVGGSETTTYGSVRTSTRSYDKASRQLRDDSVTYEGGGNVFATSRAQVSTYDDDGRAATQTTLKNGVKESYIVYGDSTYTPPGTYEYYDPFTGELVSYSWGGNYTPGYDAAGVLRGYIVQVFNTSTSNPNDIAYTSTYAMTYRNGETYQETGQTVTSTSGGPQGGATARNYNVNGELVSYVDTRDQNKNRYFANDASGQALTAVQGRFDGLAGRWNATQAFTYALANTGAYNATKSQHFFFALGQSVGSFGQLTEHGQFAANFDVNYTPVSSNYPADAPSEVVVQKGDTLRGVAARVFGDATLWYLIAEENGLTDPDGQLEPGTVLRIPNEVVSLSNTGSSFKPFDANEAIGDTTPTQPAPPAPKKKKGCGVLGQILVIVVAIVVTIYTAGAAASAIAPSASATAAGVSAGTALTASQTFALGASVLSGTAGIGAGATLAAAAIGGALGSVASQGVAIVAGIQEQFSWKSVALGAVSGGVGAGMGQIGLLSEFARAGTFQASVAAGANAVVSNVLTQGVSVALKLQDRFDWRSVAQSAIAAPLASYIGTKAGKLFGGEQALAATGYNAGKFARDVASNLTSYAVRSAMGGKFEVSQVIADIFGNAIANGLIETIERDALWDRLAYRTEFLGLDLEKLKELRAGGADPTELSRAMDGYEIGRLLDQAIYADAEPASDTGRPDGVRFQNVGLFPDSWQDLTDGLQRNADAALRRLRDLSASAPGVLEMTEYVLSTISEHAGSLAEGFYNDFREDWVASSVDILGGLALIAFDVLNSPVSPTPDAGIIGAGMWARRGAKAVEYYERFRDLVPVVQQLTSADSIRELIGDSVQLLGNLGGIGPEDAAFQTALERASEGVFRSVAPLLSDRLGRRGGARRAVGDLLMDVGQFGERVTIGLMEMSGIFQPGSVAALQNFSGHGVDVFAKPRWGEHANRWVLYEVKTGLRGLAPELSRRQRRGADWFAQDILNKAAGGGAWWVPGHSADEGMQPWARRIQREMAGRRFTGWVVRNDYIGVRQSVDVNVDPWGLRPRTRAGR